MPDEGRHYELQEPDDGDRPAKKKKPARPHGATAKRDWTCPNCGAEFTDSHALVCLECGYDIKSLKVVKTVTGKAIEVDEDGEPIDDDADAKPRVRLAVPGPLDPWLPVSIGAAALAILVIGYLAGAPGLFHPGPEETLGFSVRLDGLARFVVFVALFFGCGVVGLLFLNYLLEARVGDMRIALLRLAAIAVAMRLPAFLHLGSRAAEWTIEAFLMALVFVGLAMLLFRLALRHVATMGVSTLLAFVGAWAFAHAITWVT